MALATRRVWSAAGTLLAVALGTGAAGASGWEHSDTGAMAQGRGGAYTAQSGHPLSMLYNPGGLARLTDHALLLSGQISLAYLRADLDGGTARSHVRPTPTPLIAYAYGDPQDRWAIGIGVHGMAAPTFLGFPNDRPQRPMATEIALWPLFVDAAAAWAPHDIVSFGVTLQYVTAPHMARELEVDWSPREEPTADHREWLVRTRFEGSAWSGLSAIAGVHLRPAPFFEIGVAARLAPLVLSATGDISVDLPGTDAELDGSGATLKTRFPPWVRLGVRYQHFNDDGHPLFDIELDVAYEIWRAIAPWDLALAGPVVADGARPDLRTIGGPGTYQDAVAVKLGGDWHLIPCVLTLRLGVFYDSPTSPSRFQSMDAFDYHRLGFSIGTSFILGPVEVVAAYQLAGSLSLEVKDSQVRIQHAAASVEGAAVGNGTYTARYHTVGLSALIRFD